MLNIFSRSVNFSMAQNFFKILISRYALVPKCNLTKLQTTFSTNNIRNYSLSKFDPPYLEAMKPKTPVYDPINIQIKGYDFALLETYQSVVHNIAKTMELDVEECWSTPATTTKVNRFKPLTSVIDSEYNLTTFERNVQILDLPATLAPVFIELIQVAIPQGLTISMHPHTDEHEEIRYVPDYELDELKSELDTLTVRKKPTGT